jgi:uncharacterized protein YkvS
MAAVSRQLISHQDFSAYPERRRCIPIDGNASDITHFIEFKCADRGSVCAYVRHKKYTGEFYDPVEIPEEKIYYISDRSAIVYDSGKPPAVVALNQNSHRGEIIQKLYDRSVVVADISVDHTFYKDLALKKKTAVSYQFNKSYIILAPEIPAPVLPQNPPPRPKSPLSLQLSSPSPSPPRQTPTLYQEILDN